MLSFASSLPTCKPWTKGESLGSPAATPRLTGCCCRVHEFAIAQDSQARDGGTKWEGIPRTLRMGSAVGGTSRGIAPGRTSRGLAGWLAGLGLALTSARTGHRNSLSLWKAAFPKRASHLEERSQAYGQSWQRTRACLLLARRGGGGDAGGDGWSTGRSTPNTSLCCVSRVMISKQGSETPVDI